MENIFIYEGHTSQDINNNTNITTGIELFNKSRIRVPEGYRFITFHFNNQATTAEYTGPFILYGLKDINKEDIDNLFDKKTTIEEFRKKIFRSFVLNYTHFLSTEYDSSLTKDFSSSYTSSINPFQDYEKLQRFITSHIDSIYDSFIKKFSPNENIENENIEGELTSEEKSDFEIKYPQVKNSFVLTDLHPIDPIDDYYISLIRNYTPHTTPSTAPTPSTVPTPTPSTVPTPTPSTVPTTTPSTTTTRRSFSNRPSDKIKHKINNILINTISIKIKKIRPDYENIGQIGKIIRPDYENIGQIGKIILDRELIKEFYIEFLVLLLSEHKNIVLSDNIKNIYNYLRFNNFVHKKEEEEKSNVWESKRTERIILKEKLKDVIENFEPKLIIKICDYVKFNIRIYNTETLTPILSFHDELSFCYINNNKCTSDEDYNPNPYKKYYNYKYGFYPLEDYHKIKELPHRLIEVNNPERNVCNGLSNYSHSNRIPTNLFLHNEEYTYSSKNYNSIRAHFCHITNNLELNKKYLYDIKYFLNENNVIKYIIDHINEYKKDLRYNSGFAEYLGEIIDQLRGIIPSEYDIETILDTKHIYINNKNINYKDNDGNIIELFIIDNAQKNLIWFLICLYKFLILFYIELDYIDPEFYELTNYNESETRNIELKTYIDYLIIITLFYIKVDDNFFNHLPEGTYIITSCGCYSTNLNQSYQSLNEGEKLIFNNMIEPKEDNMIEPKEDIMIEPKEDIMIEQNSTWKKKYLKYKQKYLGLKYSLL